MTRTAPIGPLSCLGISLVEPLFVAWADIDGQRCVSSVCVWGFVHHFSVAGPSHEIFVRRELCSVVDKFGQAFIGSQDVLSRKIDKMY